MLTSSPRMSPPSLTAASTSKLSSRACPETVRFSLRSSIHLTGRPSARDAAATATSSRVVPIFKPNEPPISPARTRTWSGVDAETRGHAHPGNVHALGRRVHGQDARVGVVTGHAAAPLHRHVLVAVHVEVKLGDPVGRGEDAVDVAELAALMRAEDVGAEILEDRRAAGVEGGRRGGDRRQVLVVDLDQLAGVLGQVAALGDHHRHRVADQAHLVRASRLYSAAGPPPPIIASSGSGPRTVISSRSSPVSTATTPGSARAADASTARTRPWASGERTKAACSIPGSVTSST